MGTDAKEYNTPEWLTVPFIASVLKSFYKADDVKVTGLSSSEAGARGLSFASEMHRVQIEFERDNNAVQNLSVMIKVHPKGPAGLIAHKNRLFEREISIYTKILPKVTQLLDSINDITKISPQCYFATTDFPDVLLILEDMKCSDFAMFERGRLINLEHALPIVQKIAKLHACSAVIASQSPDLMRLYLEGPISSNPQRQDFLDFFPANIKSLAQEVREWNGYEEIAEKLFALEKTIIPKAVEMYRTDPREFRVVNLGDLWVNNIMFQCNDEYVPEDVILFDYQLAYYGSPAIDLNYLLFGSVNENVRKVHFKFIIREYHRHLKDTLERLNYTGVIPTLRDIHIEVIRKSLHAVIAAVCLAPLILMETERFTELQQLFDRSAGGEQFRKENIQNPRYKTFIQRTLKEFELSGFLD